MNCNPAWAHLSALVGVLFCYAGVSAQVPLTPVGVLPGHDIGAIVGISADGSVAFGTSGLLGAGPVVSESEAVIWTATGGLESIGTLGGAYATPNAASADGSVIVGISQNAGGASRAFRWTRAGGMQELGSFSGYFASEAMVVSADGTVIAGTAYGPQGLVPFRWLEGAGFHLLGAVPLTDVMPVAMSPDGAAIALSRVTNNTTNGGYIWTQAGGVHPLPLFENGWFPTWTSRPVWIADDGASIIGVASDATGDWTIAYRWSETGGFESTQDEGWLHLEVSWVSPDGSLIAGSRFPHDQMFISVDGREMTQVQYLERRSADLSGWESVWITGVSADHRVVAGSGWTEPTSPGSDGWVAVLPQYCYANCDASMVQPVLNVDDFTCFINEFAMAVGLPLHEQFGHYANCDGSTVAPVLNVDDFTCFINGFAAGCP